jgi:hypothetical protein
VVTRAKQSQFEGSRHQAEGIGEQCTRRAAVRNKANWGKSGSRSLHRGARGTNPIPGRPRRGQLLEWAQVRRHRGMWRNKANMWWRPLGAILWTPGERACTDTPARQGVLWSGVRRGGLLWGKMWAVCHRLPGADHYGIERSWSVVEQHRRRRCDRVQGDSVLFEPVACRWKERRAERVGRLARTLCRPRFGWCCGFDGRVRHGLAGRPLLRTQRSP